LILSIFARSGISLEAISQILGILFSAATVLLVLKTRLREEPEAGPNYLAALLLVCSGPFACWATSGLETSLFTLLIFLAVFLLMRERTALSAFVFFLASLTRPEGALVFAVAWLYLAERSPWSGNAAPFRKFILFSIVFLLPFSIYFILRTWYFGFLLPNTFYMKVGGTVWQMIRGAKYAFGFLGVTVLPLLVLARCFQGKLSKTERLVFAILGVYTSYIVLVGGDYMAMFRFFVPLIPLIAGRCGCDASVERTLSDWKTCLGSTS
jgi:hypothetical protein